MSATTSFAVVFEQPSTSSVSTTSANSNILYCKLTDRKNEMVPANVVLTLTIQWPVIIST